MAYAASRRRASVAKERKHQQQQKARINNRHRSPTRVKQSQSQSQSQSQNSPSATGISTQYRRSNLHTEVVLRKEKLTPERLRIIKEATEKLSEDDKEVLTRVFHDGDVDQTGLLVRSELHIALNSIGITCLDDELDDLLAFADADGSLAIDLDEWLMLIGLLIQPPYDEDELLTSFAMLFKSDARGNVGAEEFKSVLEEVLTMSLSPAEVKGLPQFLKEIVREFDPFNKGQIDAQECIARLVTPYN